MNSLQQDEYDHYYQQIGSGHHLSDDEYRYRHCGTLHIRCGCTHATKLMQQQPKYQNSINNEPFLYYYINSDKQYTKRLFTLIESISTKQFIPIPIQTIIIYYYSSFHHQFCENTFYCIYERRSVSNQDIKCEFNQKKREKLLNKMSYIERIDIDTNEYLTYTPTLSNGKQLSLHCESSSYIRHNNIIFKIGSNKINSNGKCTNIAYNIENGRITKLPMMNPRRFDCGLCYSDRYGLICVGGKSSFRGYNHQYKYYKNVCQLKLKNNKMEWISLPNISNKRYASSCLILDNMNKMIVCGGKTGIYNDAYNSDSFQDSKCCQLYDFIDAKWISLKNIPHSVSWNGALTQSKRLNNNIVALYGRKCMSYDFHKNEWYMFADSNNSYYYSFKLSESKIFSTNVLTVIGLEEIEMNIGCYTGKYYSINIEMYDNRSNSNKWIEIKSIDVDNQNLKAIV